MGGEVDSGEGPSFGSSQECLRSGGIAAAHDLVGRRKMLSYVCNFQRRRRKRWKLLRVADDITEEQQPTCCRLCRDNPSSVQRWHNLERQILNQVVRYLAGNRKGFEIK